MPTTSRRSPPPAASPTSRSRGRSSRERRHRTAGRARTAEIDERAFADLFGQGCPRGSSPTLPAFDSAGPGLARPVCPPAERHRGQARNNDEPPCRALRCSCGEETERDADERRSTPGPPWSRTGDLRWVVSCRPTRPRWTPDLPRGAGAFHRRLPATSQRAPEEGRPHSPLRGHPDLPLRRRTHHPAPHARTRASSHEDSSQPGGFTRTRVEGSTLSRVFICGRSEPSSEAASIRTLACSRAEETDCAEAMPA
jgi:hypothetical protein